MYRIFFFASVLAIFSCSGPRKDSSLAAPTARKDNKVFNEQGIQRTDPYFWLNNREDSNVINHLEAENAYMEAYMAHTVETQKKIYDELVARIEQKYESLPVKNNGYWYYARFEENKQYPLYCRKEGSNGAPEKIMLDINELAKGHQIYLVRGRAVSRDNQWLAFAEDTSGDRRCTLRLLNLGTNAYGKESIRNTSGDYAWSNDHKTIYYVLNDHTVRPYRVMKHVLGTDPSTDQELYTEKDSTYDVSLSTDRNNKYIFITSGSTTTTESRFLDANNPASTPRLIQARIRDLLYYPSYAEGNQFLVYHNKDAKNFKVSVVDIASPGIAGWKDLVPHEDSALLERFEMLRDYIVLQHRHKGLPRITIINRKDNSRHSVDFGEEAFVADMSLATDDYATDSIRYSYSSLTTPATDYMYGLSDHKKTMLKQQKVGGGYDAGLYETRRLWARAADGVMVPVSIVYRKSELKKDGTNPLLLYAYGSYGASTDPYFNSSVISLLDRGFVFGIAHVRGGQEMGRYWYEDGKLLKKKNTFTDFIDCAQYLVNEKYTSPDRLFANGGSAGGMLMGAITNMRPDLFRGILAEVPWMDVITDMFNTDLPLTTLEFDEWGDPRKQEYFDYMMSWSPYDNVKPTKFPAIFATGGLNDTQVPYFSPAKWVLKVRENNQGPNPVLFKCNMGAGHGGESGRFERQKLTATKYAFMLDQLGK
ncbi:MAG: S9 family peptidase [Chitinophagaceae bacterium]|nr:S9 family peptidase [Chitinophagaceae bacterium]